MDELKTLVEVYTGLGKDALHIHFALLIYLIAAAAFKDSRSILPWLIVLAVELCNEALDLKRHHDGLLAWLWDESIKDLWNTMLWPTALLLLTRYTNIFGVRQCASNAGGLDKM